MVQTIALAYARTREEMERMERVLILNELHLSIMERKKMEMERLHGSLEKKHRRSAVMAKLDVIKCRVQKRAT